MITGDVHAVALDQLAEMRDARADGAVDVLPVVKELFVGEPGFAGDAVDELDHGVSVTQGWERCRGEQVPHRLKPVRNKNAGFRGFEVSKFLGSRFQSF